MNNDFLPLMQAATYLGVSRMKLSRLVNEGTISYVTSPLDKRVKLFKRIDLDALKQVGPHATQGHATAHQADTEEDARWHN